MSSPFEDQIWKYIAERRPLKVAFLSVAVVGVFGSAVKTIEPGLTEAVGVVRRYLDSKPSAEVREKYGCAYQTGQSYWTLSRSMAAALKEPRSETWIANVALQEIRLCQRMFQYAPVVTDIPTKSTDGLASVDEWKLHFAVATNSWNEFQAHLAAKDRQALALLRLGSEFSTARMGLSYSSVVNAQAFSGPLHPDLQQDVVKKLADLHDEAQSKFPYRLPARGLSTSSAKSLLESITAAEARFASYFRGDA